MEIQCWLPTFDLNWSVDLPPSCAIEGMKRIFDCLKSGFDLRYLSCNTGHRSVVHFADFSRRGPLVCEAGYQVIFGFFGL